MRVNVRGTCVAVERSDYTNAAGQRVETFDAYVRADGDNGKYPADRISGPAHLAPAEGQRVDLLVNATAKLSKAGNAYLSTWAISSSAPYSAA